MNRLVLAFGIVCFLQGLSAEPKPGFGVANSITATSKITAVKSDANTISNEIKGITIAALTSGMTKLDTTKTKIETIITQFDTKLKAVTGAYDTLVAANQGDITNTFAPFIAAIDAAVTYINGDGATIASDISGLTYTGISDELTDAFTRIVGGLNDLKAKTSAAREAILAAVNAGALPQQAGDTTVTVSSAALRQFVTLKIMYDLLNSATKLRTYLPLVKYILQTVKENLEEADAYVNSIKTALNTDVATVSNQYTNDLVAATSSIKIAVASDFGTSVSALTNLGTRLNALTGITSAPKAADLLAKISALKDNFGTALTTGTTNMETALTHISTALAALITSLKNAVVVVDNPLLNKLIDTLMGYDEYGRYCYHKYKDLVEGLFDVSFDGGALCVDKELARLEHLKMTLLFIIDQLTYDYEDIESQIGVCDSLGMASNSNTAGCVAALNQYYGDLFAATADKINLVFTIASDEAVAVENRLLICFNLVNLDTTVVQVAAIDDHLTICRNSGPLGSD